MGNAGEQEAVPAQHGEQLPVNPVQEIIGRKVSELRRERQSQFPPEIQQRIADYARGDTKKAVGFTDVQKNVANAVKSEFVKRKFAEHPEEPIKAVEPKPKARLLTPAEEFNQQRRKEASEERKARQEQDQKDVEAINASHKKDNVPLQVKIAKPDLTESQKQGVAALEQAFGKRFIFVEPEKGSADPNGYVPKSKPDVMLINANTPYHPVAVMGHEFIDSLAYTHPELHKELVESMKQFIKKDKEYLARLNAARKKGGFAKRGIGLAHEEITADFGGERLLDPKFLEKFLESVSKDDPGLFQKIVTAIREWFAKTRPKLVGSEHISDIDAAEEALLRVLKKIHQKGDKTESTPETKAISGIDRNQSRIDALEKAASRYESEGKSAMAAAARKNAQALRGEPKMSLNLEGGEEMTVDDMVDRIKEIESDPFEEYAWPDKLREEYKESVAKEALDEEDWHTLYNELSDDDKASPEAKKWLEAYEQYNKLPEGADVPHDIQSTLEDGGVNVSKLPFISELKERVSKAKETLTQHGIDPKTLEDAREQIKVRTGPSEERTIDEMVEDLQGMREDISYYHSWPLDLKNEFLKTPLGKAVEDRDFASFYENLLPDKQDQGKLAEWYDLNLIAQPIHEKIMEGVKLNPEERSLYDEIPWKDFDQSREWLASEGDSMAQESFLPRVQAEQKRLEAAVAKYGWKWNPDIEEFEDVRGEMPVRLSVVKPTAEEGIARIKEHLQRQNEELGRDDIPEDIRQSIPESFDRASQKLTADPKSGEKLVDQLVENPRQVTPDESALLSEYLVSLDNGLKANAKIINAAEADPSEKAEAQMRYAELDAKLDNFQTASLKAGSEWGRVGRWMQQRLKEDYSLANMLTRAKTKAGGKLNERDTAEITKLHAELEDHRKRLAEKDKQIAELTLENIKEEHGDFESADWWKSAKESMSPERLKVAENLENELRRQNEIRKALAQIEEEEKAAANAATEEPKERLSILSPEDIKTSIKGKSKAELLKELADSEAKSDKLFSSLEKGASGPVKKAAARIRAKKGEAVDISKVGKALEEFKDKGLSDVPHSLLEEIAKYHIQKGVKTTEELSGKIAETLRPVGDFTPEEINAALSKYGQVKFPSKEATAVELRKHKGVMRLLSQLKDVLAGQYPKKTGPQRDKPSARERELTKEVMRKLKDLGIEPPEGDKKALASRRQAIVSRLQNEIEELNRVIEGKAKPKGEIEPPEYDAEMKALKKERDELAAYVKDLTGPSPAHEWNERARKAAERLAKLYDERIEALKRGEKPQGPKPTPEATAATQKAKDAATAKREEYQKLRDTLHPEIQEAKDTASLVKRLQKRREDLVKRLIKGKEPETPGKQVKQTPESEALQKEVDRLSDAIKQIEGPRRLTEEQRTAAAEKAIQKSIAEVERRIKEGDLKPKAKGAPVEESPKLKALRQEKAFLDEIHDSMKEAANPLSEREIAHYQKVLEQRSADYEGRLKQLEQGTYKKREAKVRELTQAQAAEKIKGDRLRKQFQIKLREVERANWPTTKKLIDKAVRFRRAGLLSNPATAAKLAAFGVSRLGSTAAEEAIGGGFSKLFPQLAAKAEVEGGGFNAGRYAKAIGEARSQGMKDAWDILSKGSSDLEAKFDKEPHDQGWLDWPGRLHAAIKAPFKRFRYEQIRDKLIEQAGNPTDDLTLRAIEAKAYLESNRAIGMQDNLVSKAWGELVNRIDKAGHPLAAGTMKALLPIVKVPTNLAHEATQYIGGLPIGLYKAAKAYRAGIENLKPEEADLVLRQLKKGSIGSAMMLLGFLGAGSIGGYYNPDEKRKAGDVKPGAMRIFGVDVPSFLFHAPIFEAMNMGASLRRGLGAKQTLPDAAMASAMGLLEHVPFVNEVFRLHDFRNAKTRSQFINEFAKQSIEPLALQKLAEWTDRSRPLQASDLLTGEGTNKRAPEGLGQTLESGVPGLRGNVPLKIPKPLEGTQLILPHGLDFSAPHKADIEKKNPRVSDAAWEKFNELRSERIRALVVPKINALKRMTEDDARHAVSEITRVAGVYAKQRTGLR